MKFYQRFLPYAVAIGSTAIALLLTLSLEALLTQSVTVFFVISITVSTWYGGLKPGLVAILLSTLAVNISLIPPPWQFTGLTVSDFIRLASFSLVAGVIQVLSHNLKNSKRRVEQLSQQLLEKTTEQLRMVLSATQMGLWDWNILTGKIYWSPEQEQLFGWVPGTYDGKYQTFEACLHPEDREKLNQAIERALKERVPYQHEYRIIWPDGSIHWIEERGQVFYDESGQPVHMTGTVMAIDERKQTQTSLQERAQQMLNLQAVITRNMAEGICLVKVDNGVIVYANPKFEQMFGYEAGELNGQHVSIVNYATEEVTAEDVTKAIISIILATGEATYEVHNIKKDGTPFWCRATASIFKHPEYGDVLVVVQQDITIAKHLEAIRQQAEKELRQSQANFRSLSESSPIGIFMTDIYGQCIYTNPRYQIICGCTFDELLGEGCIKFLHPDDRERVITEWSKAVSQRQEFSSEIRYVHKDGIIRFTQVRSAPIVSVSDELIGYVGTVEDITERQGIEQMKSEFISVVSHELRTPLTAIHGGLNLLSTGLVAPNSERGKHVIKIAAESAEHLVRLVNDILELERLESRKICLTKQVVNSADLLLRAMEQTQILANQTGIHFEVCSQSLECYADPDRVLQVLTNLLSNAIKFSDFGDKIWLSVEEKPGEEHPDNRSILFKVRDQGRGIPQDKIERIFERFQQVDASDSRQKGGTGLGLAICKSIVQQHGGRIWVESVVGEGSCFCFTLPKQLN